MGGYNTKKPRREVKVVWVMESGQILSLLGR